MQYLKFLNKIVCTVFIFAIFIFLVIPSSQALTRDEVSQRIQEKKQSQGLTKAPVKNIRSGKINILPMRLVQNLPNLFEYATGSIQVKVTGRKDDETRNPLPDVRLKLELMEYKYPYNIEFSSRTVYSNANGEASFHDVLFGKYKVTATSSGYVETYIKEVVVDEQSSPANEFRFYFFIIPPTEPTFSPPPFSLGGSTSTVGVSGPGIPSPMPTPVPTPAPLFFDAILTPADANTSVKIVANKPIKECEGVQMNPVSNGGGFQVHSALKAIYKYSCQLFFAPLNTPRYGWPYAVKVVSFENEIKRFGFWY